MKFRRCQNCVSNFDDITHCMEVCTIPIEILKAVEEYFNNRESYPEDLEYDLSEIVESE